ncbi:S9 family peptidase [Nannocystis sp. SCPEA4]|uniref:S9 family peptidase n=1 Tax=Nannocystis sp. SCPEA4 TaxID=2996787 RepID=UPI00226D7AC9|nr:S9 family peptidase [Nannocystis sp. SCPEA4]MCY1062910.1 S9 family peptidase [Nannocystis sp. SCPEA4]
MVRVRPRIRTLLGLSTLAVACGGTRERVARDCPPAASPAPEEAKAADAGPTAPAPFVEQAIAPPGQHPFSVLDLLAFDRISDPQVSPNGKKVAFVVRKTDLEGNRGRSDLYVMGIDGSGPIRLTTDPESESSPRWTSDSETLYFLGKHEGKQQVFRVAIGETPTRVSDFPVDVGAILLGPGGTLLFSAEVFPECDGASEGPLACTAGLARDRARKDRGTGVVHNRLFVRHWDEWEDGRRAQLFAWSPGGGGQPVHVSRGIDGDVPSKPFGGVEEWAVTPDGHGVVFAARVAGQTEPWSTNFDLFYAPLDGSAAPKNLSQKNLAWDTRPAFSPDGKTLAYVAMARPGYEADRFSLVLQPWPEGQPKILTGDWDRSVEEFTWSGDGKTIFAVAEDLGRTSLFAVDAATGSAHELVRGGAIHDVQRVDDRLLFLRNDLSHPDEIFTAKFEGETEATHRSTYVPGQRMTAEQLSHLNDAKVAAADVGVAEQFSFPGHKNEMVYGWVVRPPGLAEGDKAPVAFLIHGGPQGSFSDRWSYRWNPQTYAGAGYAVVMIDFHGSTGYGQAFTDTIQDDWGGAPLVDLQKGLAAALQRYPWLDGDRVCALGASYGGFMVNWIASQWQAPFRCLVNHDGVFDNRMMYYATEELWFPEWEHRGPYWQFGKQHEAHNPANYVDRWRLPMLVIHGGLDYRIPETQGIATFTALQRRGVPSRFVYFPDENHWVLKPVNSKLWHDNVLAWLDTWLRTPTAKPGAAK